MNCWVALNIFLSLRSIGFCCCVTNDSLIKDERAAADWLKELDGLLAVAYNDWTTAYWDYNVNLTSYNKQKLLEASGRESSFLRQVHQNATKFDWKNFEDLSIKRQFSIVVDIGNGILPADDNLELETLRSKMQEIYSTAELCQPRPGGETLLSSKNNTCYPLNPDLNSIVAKSRSWDEQVWAWKGWRDITGKKMKQTYIEMVQLVNKAAKLNGFQDNGEYWRSWYEMPNFREECEKLWSQVKPLYQQLHAYIRRQLMQAYNETADQFPSSGHIPAHLTGNLWSQTWGHILQIVLPFKHIPSANVTKSLLDKGYNVTKMFQLSDEFFRSLGLEPMSDEFWKRSMLERPKDGRQVVCHASAWDFFDHDDFRIKQCSEVTSESLMTAHHEMGHVQYYLQYKHHPIVFRKGANPGFHEAVGDLMTLSVTTPEHLQKVGLLESVNNSYEHDINYLMNIALDKVAFLPFGYTVDRWRWSVFEGKTQPENYNRDWWNLRCQLQGISPPVTRTEDDFDAGAKFHVASNTPYIRYFVSFIIQFQFHKHLCQAAGQGDLPLHRCDIYNSSAAGAKLREMLRLGSSKPWWEAMQVITGNGSIDAGPLLEYFQPLHDWLKVQNAGHNITWEDGCPIGTVLSSGAPPTSLSLASSLTIFILVGCILTRPPLIPQ